MPEFIETTACKGRKPESMTARRYFSRPNLIAKLLRERHVARFIVAPDGFGKSSLACEYADTVFSFNHVFWINGKSPCFLRDLDREDLPTRLGDLDPSPFLAVFEDVPPLDAERSERLSRAIDELLEAGNEVLVTCTPTGDAYAKSHRDRTKLDAASLLLSEEECALDRTRFAPGKPQVAPPRAERIACLQWGSDDGKKLLDGIAQEELPGDVALALVVMLTLREGYLSDLEAFLPHILESDSIDLLESGYPLLGIDRRSEQYRAANFPLRAIARAFGESFDALASRSLFSNRDVLAERLADALVARSQSERACELMKAIASKSACATWLLNQHSSLLRAACLKPAHDLFTFIGRTRHAKRAALNVSEAWRLAALGDNEAACALARPVAFSDTAAAGERTGALIVILICGDEKARTQAEGVLRGLLQAWELDRSKLQGTLKAHFKPPQSAHDTHHGPRSVSQDPSDTLTDMDALANLTLAPIVLALRSGIFHGVEAWSRERKRVANAMPSASSARESAHIAKAGSAETAALVAGAMLILNTAINEREDRNPSAAVAHGNAAANATSAGKDAMDRSAEAEGGHAGGGTSTNAASQPQNRADESPLENPALFVLEQLESANGTTTDETIDLFLAMATIALEKVVKQGLAPCSLLPQSQDILSAHRIELNVLDQRIAYRKETDEQGRRRDNYYATHPNAFRDERRVHRRPSTEKEIAPMLRVNLFGGFEVWIGSDPVDPHLFRRQKTRTLLALLVLNRGKEFARDRLAQALWPESKLESARKNLYSIWSQLRRALITPAGTCPYLIRSQSGCRIDARLLDSDVMQFESFCRALLFGNVRIEEWEPLFAQLNAGFSDDLLPGESACDLIAGMRDEYRTRLTDALISASSRLVEAGETRGGLWFAREALKRDHTREDVYAALMEAQIAAGQRTAALETYFSCRQYLTSELGIDPSVRTVQLYRSVIEAEESMDW